MCRLPIRYPDIEAFVPITTRTFDSLVLNDDGSWDETRLDTGTVFSTTLPDIFASLAYYQTVTGQQVSMNYNDDGTLASIEGPGGRSISLAYNSDQTSKRGD